MCDAGDDRLNHELRWVVLHPFLRSRGYEMRARYQPDWVPSWSKSPKPRAKRDCEDAVRAIKPGLVDAIRVKDDTPVFLKLMDPKEDGSERFSQYFGQPGRANDPRNCICPVLEVLRPDVYPDHAILVMPRLVPWNLWPFRQISEAVNFFSQVFEGLAFMHEHNFAHLDIGVFNIMMDGLHLYLEPGHPSKPLRALNGPHDARHVERYKSRKPVRYYFIDLEGSIRFDSYEERCCVERVLAADTTPEELAQPGTFVDPFAIDVYCLGNLIREHWLEAYTNVEFMRPLVEDMTQTDPSLRPTASEALERFQAIYAAVPPKQLTRSLRRNLEYFYHTRLFKAMLANDIEREKEKARERKLAARAARGPRRGLVHLVLQAFRGRSRGAREQHGSESTLPEGTDVADPSR